MKRAIQYLFIAALAAVLPHVICAQVEATANEIGLRRLKAERLLQTVPSVQAVVEETLDAATGKVSLVTTRTREVVPPEKERVIAEVHQKDGSNKKYYSIRIGDVSYTRSDQGEWQRNEGREFSGPVAGAQVSATFQFLGNENLSGTMVDVFKIRSTYSYRNEPSSSGNETTYFFDKSGHVRKTVIETFDKLGPNRRITTHYSYPKEIQIEAPIN